MTVTNTDVARLGSAKHLIQSLFGIVVDRACRFVEEYEIRLAYKYASKTDALLLPKR